VILVGRDRGDAARLDESSAGRLPEDFSYRGKNTTVYFPLATSVLVSVVFLLVLRAVNRWRK
jgi:hypothetical protein